MGSRILTFKIDGRHRHFSYPPFATFTVETAKFWHEFQEEIARTNNQYNVPTVKRATFDKLTSLLSRNGEVNSDIWLHVEPVDIRNPGTSRVNELVSIGSASDEISDKVSVEA